MQSNNQKAFQPCPHHPTFIKGLNSLISNSSINKST
uniref:Uncharacterized protein n=1 Tax=Rhizophora mucronata TaxID=61149 RepID=A0A2P2QXM0_RHIMU